MNSLLRGAQMDRKSAARRPAFGPDLSGQRNAAMERGECGSHLSPFGVFYIWQHIIGALLGWGTKKKKKRPKERSRKGWEWGRGRYGASYRNMCPCFCVCASLSVCLLTASGETSLPDTRPAFFTKSPAVQIPRHSSRSRLSFSLRQVLCDPADPQQQPLHGGGGQQVWLQHVWADYHEPRGDHVYPSLTKTSMWCMPGLVDWSSSRVAALLRFSDTSLFDLCWLWPFQHRTAVCLLSHVVSYYFCT